MDNCTVLIIDKDSGLKELQSKLDEGYYVISIVPCGSFALAFVSNKPKPT